MFCINFESFKLTIDLKLLIVVVLISILILFFHIWYIIIISERKVYFGYEICQLGLGLMDIRDGAGMGLLILLLTGWEPINLPRHGFVPGMGSNCIIGCGNGMGMTYPKLAPLPFLVRCARF